jgi:hypothetical protein
LLFVRKGFAGLAPCAGSLYVPRSDSVNSGHEAANAVAEVKPKRSF